MGTEVVDLAQQGEPLLTAALGAYGGTVLTRAENAAADAAANAGRRLLQAVWHRRDPAGQTALEAAVQDAAEDTGDAEAAAALRRRVKRALRVDPALLDEIAALLPGTSVSGGITVTATGERSKAAHTIGTAITGDSVRITQPPPGRPADESA